MRSILRMWIAVLVCAAFAAVVLTGNSALGQGITTGSIAAVVADQQGAVVPQASTAAL